MVSPHPHRLQKPFFADVRIRFRHLFIAFEDQKQAIYHVQSAKDLTTVWLTRDHLYPSEGPARFSGSKISRGLGQRPNPAA
jgi:hypothetical protein